MNKVIPSLLAATLMASSAVAEVVREADADINYKKFYVNAEYQSLDMQGTSIQAKGLTGGYYMTDALAVQVSYLVGDEQGIDLTALNVDLVGKIPFNEFVSLHTEIGFTQYEEEGRWSTYDDNAVHASVGIAFENDDVAITLAYQTYMFDEYDFNADGFGASIGFKF